MFLWRLLMSDDLPSPGKGVYLFFEFVALGLVLEAVADIIHWQGPWYRWTASLVAAALFLFLGIKGGNILNWLRSKLSSGQLAMVVAENAELKKQLTAGRER